MESFRHIGRPLILASQSPRRQQILEQMGFRFSVIPPTIGDESAYIDSRDLSTSLRRLATAKANSIAVRHGGDLVLGSDTIVVLDNRIMGKPVDKDDAQHMLESLCGKTHTVLSAVALVCRETSFELAVTVATDVTFRFAAPVEIDEYLTHGEYADKAGAYAIQGRAMTFVERIAGCFYNVMGLPMSATIDLFSAFLKAKGS